MAHLWHGAEIVPINQHIALELRSNAELQRIRDEKQALAKHLEMELFMLRQPSELQNRIAALEGAILVAENGDNMDPEERVTLLRKLIEDLRDDHHHHLALHDQGQQAIELPHGIVLQVAEHPILTEHRAQADYEEWARKHPSEQPCHPDIGRPGVFAEQFKLVPNPYNERGFDYRKEAGIGRSQWQATVDEMEEFDKKVAESKFGQVISQVGENIQNSVPQFITEVFGPKQVEAPRQYGCGDVYVDKDRAKSTGRAMRWQMAEAGLPVYGKAPRVTAEWLKENNIVKSEG